MKTSLKTVQFFLLFASINLFSQQNKVKIEVNKLTNQVYELVGQGGNIGLFVGNDGVFMIDDQFAPLTPKILAAIKTITKKTVKYLFNTHWHGDHTGGNENMYKAGAIIVAQANVRKRMNAKQLVRGVQKAATPKGALPVITFTEDLSFHLNGDDLMISHVHHAHTDGDAIIYFTKNNVLHMGDVYFEGKFPYIDISSGGGIDGYVAGIQRAIMLSDNQTIIIPGHGNISNKAALKPYLHMLKTIRKRVLAQKKAGKTLEEVTKNKAITAEFDAKFGGGFISAAKMRESVYKSLIVKNK